MAIVYNDNANIYLQGKNALLPIEVTEEYISYYIGDESAQLEVKDFRKTSWEEAKYILDGKNGSSFAKIFNQAAYAIVKRSPDDSLKIELREKTNDGEFPTLWLGVLEDNLMPNYGIIWEYLRPTNSGGTAIAVLLPED